jgi:hypothetical protein
MIERHINLQRACGLAGAFIGFWPPGIAQKVFARRPDRRPVHPAIVNDAGQVWTADEALAVH